MDVKDVKDINKYHARLVAATQAHLDHRDDPVYVAALLKAAREYYWTLEMPILRDALRAGVPAELADEDEEG
jgi:hypothetical protein